MIKSWNMSTGENKLGIKNRRKSEDKRRVIARTRVIAGIVAKVGAKPRAIWIQKKLERDFQQEQE